jgi:hypothetical protein
MQKNEEPNSNNMIRLQDLDLSKISFSEFKKSGKVSFTNLYYNGDQFQIKMDEKLMLTNANAPNEDNPKYSIKFRTTDKEYIQKMYDLENTLHKRFPGKQYNSIFGKDFWSGDQKLPSSIDFNFKFKKSEHEDRVDRFSKLDFLDEHGILDESITATSFEEGVFEKGTTGNVIFEIAGYEGAGNIGYFFRPQYIRIFPAEPVPLEKLFERPMGHSNKRPRLEED